MRKLKDEKILREKQWNQWVKEQKQNFAKQRRQFETDIARIDRDLLTAAEVGNQAAERVKILVNNGPTALVEEESKEDVAMGDEWERLVQRPATQEEHSAFYREALAAAGQGGSAFPGLRATAPPGGGEASVPAGPGPPYSAPMPAAAHPPNPYLQTSPVPGVTHGLGADSHLPPPAAGPMEHPAPSAGEMNRAPPGLGGPGMSGDFVPEGGVRHAKAPPSPAASDLADRLAAKRADNRTAVHPFGRPPKHPPPRPDAMPGDEQGARTVTEIHLDDDDDLHGATSPGLAKMEYIIFCNQLITAACFKHTCRLGSPCDLALPLVLPMAKLHLGQGLCLMVVLAVLSSDADSHNEVGFIGIPTVQYFPKYSCTAQPVLLLYVADESPASYRPLPRSPWWNRRHWSIASWFCLGRSSSAWPSSCLLGVAVWQALLHNHNGAWFGCLGPFISISRSSWCQKDTSVAMGCLPGVRVSDFGSPLEIFGGIRFSRVCLKCCVTGVEPLWIGIPLDMHRIPCLYVQMPGHECSVCKVDFLYGISRLGSQYASVANSFRFLKVSGSDTARAPNTCIGSSGARAAQVAELFSALRYTLLEHVWWIGQTQVVFFISLSLVSFLALCGLLVPWKRGVLASLGYAPRALIICWRIGDPSSRPLNVCGLTNKDRPLKGLSCANRQHALGCRGFGICYRILCFLHTPICVWAAPTGFSEAITALETASIFLPESMGHGFNTGEVSDKGSVDPQLFRAPEEEWPRTNATRHCVMFQAGFPTKYMLVYVELPCSEDEFLSAAAEMVRDRAFMHSLVATSPQVGDGLSSIIAVPHWTEHSDQTAFVLDFSFWGGPVYAVIDWRHVTVLSLSEAARIHAPEAWQVFHVGMTEPLQQDQHINASPGDVFRFVPLGHHPGNSKRLGQMLIDTASWDPCPSFVPRELINHSWFAPQSHVTRYPVYSGDRVEALKQVAAEAFHSDLPDLDFEFPEESSSLQELVHRGFLMQGVLAAVPKSTSGRRNGVFVFLDPRLIGRKPFFPLL